MGTEYLDRLSKTTSKSQAAVCIKGRCRIRAVVGKEIGAVVAIPAYLGSYWSITNLQHILPTWNNIWLALLADLMI